MAKIEDWAHDFDSFDRESGLGGTDAGGVAGIHPYVTPLDVYLNKRGEGRAFVGSDAALFGTLFEPVIADQYWQRRKLGRDTWIKEMIEPGTLRHPDHPWAYGTPDRIIVGTDGRWLYGLEIKTCGARKEREWGEAGSHKYPHEYLAQCVWYLWICRALCERMGWPLFEHWDLAVLIGGQDYRHYRIYHDPDLESQIVGAASDFWEEAIGEGVPPEITARDAHNLPILWPRDDGHMIEANDDQAQLLAEYEALSAEIAERKSALDEIKTAIKIIIGEAAGIIGPGFKATWKASRPRRTVDYKKLAESYDPTPEQLDAHTSLGKPVRTFRTLFKREKQ